MSLERVKEMCSHPLPDFCEIQWAMSQHANQMTDNRNLGMEDGRLLRIDFDAREERQQSRCGRCQRKKADETASDEGHSV